MYYLCSENKGADQLHGYRKADLRLCFCICKKPVLSRCGSFHWFCHPVHIMFLIFMTSSLEQKMFLQLGAVVLSDACHKKSEIAILLLSLQ